MMKFSVLLLKLTVFWLQPNCSHLLVVNLKPPCPKACSCIAEEAAVTCVEMLPCCTWRDILVTNEYNKVKSLNYRGQIHEIPAEVRLLKYLVNLTLSYTELTKIEGNAFSGLQNLLTLDLSHNLLNALDVNAFSALNSLHTLNLSGNQLTTLPEYVFSHLQETEVIILSKNNLIRLPKYIFQGLFNLKRLDLSWNRLTFLASDYVIMSHKLKFIDVSHNQISSLHDDVCSSLQNRTFLEINLSDNPIDCSCSLNSILDLILYKNITFTNLNQTLCNSPALQHGVKITNLLSKQPVCKEPVIVSLSNDTVVYYRSNIDISCRATGSPDPVVVWKLPWGQLIAHPMHLSLLGDLALNTSSALQYYGNPLLFGSVISAQENGVLHIEHFRGLFHGNYTCYVINSLGNDSATIYLYIASHIPSVYFMSLYVSFGCSGAFFVLGIIIGALKVLVMFIRSKCCGSKVEDKKEKSVVILDEVKINVPDIDSKYESENENSETSSAACVVESGSDSLSESPPKFTTPSGDSPSGWIPSNIVDTLEEVRGRLRYGVERKMEKMRSQVKSIKDSGSTYVHSFKESSIQAADRVKAGVVLGVESLKITAQSFKEFCGTGDMGGQTISMVSVSTDVDTSEKTEVIRAVTFV